MHRPRRPLMCLAASFLADSVLINVSVLSLRVNLAGTLAIAGEPVGD